MTGLRKIGGRSRVLGAPRGRMETRTRIHARLARTAVAALALVLPAAAASADATFVLGAPMATQAGTQGASVSYDIAVFPSGGFSDPVSLSVTGLPAGATASFSPNPAAPVAGGPAATLTVTLGASTPTGSHGLTVTGTSGSITQSTGLTLVVNPGGGGGGEPASFTLGAPLASQAVTQGGSVAYSIAIFATGGFSDPVSLSASGLPAGASASFSPNPATPGSTASTLTVTTGSATPAGSHTFTVTGTSGAITQTTGLTLVVNTASGGGGGGAATFALGAVMAAQAVAQGGTATYQLTIAPQNGFGAAVTVAVSGLPAGATASVSPNPAAPVAGGPAATLTVATGAGTPVGSHNLTVTGTGGGVTRTTGVTLVVSAASGGPGGAAPPSPSPAPGGGGSASAVASGSDPGTLAVGPVGGTSPGAAVTWAPGTFGGQPVTVSASLAQPPGQSFAAGGVVVNLKVTAADGSNVTSFAEPLEIAFPNAPPNIVPMYSQDGTSWTAIPQLAGTTLPQGQPDGWYRAGSTVYVLTRHATLFGLAKALSLTAQVAQRVSLRRPALTVAVAPSLASAVALELRRGRTVVARWTRSVQPKPTQLRLPLPVRARKPGSYTLVVTAAAGPQRLARTYSVRVVR